MPKWDSLYHYDLKFGNNYKRADVRASRQSKCEMGGNYKKSCIAKKLSVVFRYLHSLQPTNKQSQQWFHTNNGSMDAILCKKPSKSSGCIYV